ncbi:MAG: TerB family tellurite resistance protein [Pseudomonadota bacterium]
MAGFLDTIKSMLERDKTVRLVANDPALTAELLLLFRVMLADGEVRDEELFAFKSICRSAFGLNPEAMTEVYKYLEDFGYEMTADQTAEIFRELSIDRRRELLDRMIQIAESDNVLDPRELALLGRTADMLGFDLKGGTIPPAE